MLITCCSKNVLDEDKDLAMEELLAGDIMDKTRDQVLAQVLVLRVDRHQ